MQDLRRKSQREREFNETKKLYRKIDEIEMQEWKGLLTYVIDGHRFLNKQAAENYVWDNYGPKH